MDKIEKIKENERAIKGALMATMVYHQNIDKIGKEPSPNEKDEDVIVMQRAFNKLFTPVQFPKYIISGNENSVHSLAHSNFEDTKLINTEYTYKNGVYSPGKKGTYGDMAGALITTSDDPENPGKKVLNVAFRGTDDSKAGMLDYVTKAYPDMEKYYHENFIPLESLIKDYAKDPKNNISSIDVSGHSLGGAMVHRFVESLESDKNLKTENRGVTFGSPGYLSRSSPSVAPKTENVRAIRACAIEDFTEKNGEWVKTSIVTAKMFGSAVKKAVSYDDDNTQRVIKIGDVQANQRFNHLNVKQFAHDYDPVTKYGYLEKQRVGNVEKITDYYKSQDYKKFESTFSSFVYHSTYYRNEYKEQIDNAMKDMKIPQTDNKYLNVGVDVLNKGIDLSNKGIRNLWGNIGAVQGSIVAIVSGNDGKKYAAEEMEKMVAVASHGSDRYVKNLFIKAAKDSQVGEVSPEDIERFAPTQKLYRDTKKAVVAEKHEKDGSVQIPLKLADAHNSTSLYIEANRPKNFNDFMKKVDVMVDNFNEKVGHENNSRNVFTPIKRI